METSDSPREMPEGVFPLPLSPMEYFLLLDDRQDHPMTMVVELHFEGQLDLTRFDAAIRSCLRLHPLLASRVEFAGNYPHWRFDPGFVPKLEEMGRKSVLAADDVAGLWRMRPFDLTSEPGFRIWHDCGAAESRLILQLHHAVCDGIGIRNFLIDLLAEYAKQTGAAVQSNRNAPEWNRLLDRADFSAMERSTPKVKLRWWDKLRNAYYFYLQPPHSLSAVKRNLPDTSMADEEAKNHPLLHRVFDRESSSAIAERCKREKVRLNDLVLAILFRTCHRWNTSCGVESKRARIRLLMPVDLRRRMDRRLPAANRLSFGFLGRTHGQCESWKSLLQSVQSETQQIKDTRVYMDFLRGLRGLSKYPDRFRRAIDANRNMATAVLTYSGDLARGLGGLFPREDRGLRVGGVALSRVLAAPPARENTNIALGVCRNWGQVCISINWSRNVFSVVDAQDFLDSFASSLNAWCEGEL